MDKLNNTTVTLLVGPWKCWQAVRSTNLHCQPWCHVRGITLMIWLTMAWSLTSSVSNPNALFGTTPDSLFFYTIHTIAHNVFVCSHKPIKILQAHVKGAIIEAVSPQISEHTCDSSTLSFCLAFVRVKHWRYSNVFLLELECMRIFLYLAWRFWLARSTR